MFKVDSSGIIPVMDEVTVFDFVDGSGIAGIAEKGNAGTLAAMGDHCSVFDEVDDSVSVKKNAGFKLP